ncbi:MAG: hypothetical protein CVU34_17790 [Betaproteobacteria bacterium HGW-Betaproteobacteria-7]|jgi:hypothetical protein|nr:MAG: hypothetical protein CVU34_17790 [Betaproteobacteria bacterium HGW-Betaproteobacteria-7]
MPPFPEDTITKPFDLRLEIRSANGSSTEFFQSDEQHVRATLPLLAAPRLFTQPHLLLASEDCASMIPCKGIDMIMVRTTAPLPLKFPLELPAGLFDIAEHSDPRPDKRPAAIEAHDGQPRQRNSLVEIHTLGGWVVTLETVAMFRGNAHDERQFFSRLTTMLTIPFRLAEGGFGLINNVNIVRVSAWPKPEMLPGLVLPLSLRR